MPALPAKNKHLAGMNSHDTIQQRAFSEAWVTALPAGLAIR
jgi:hypothetical protein